MGLAQQFGILYSRMQPFIVYWFSIFSHFILQRVPLIMLSSKMVPHIRNFEICQTTIITWTHLSGFHFTSIQITYTIIFQTDQRANEIDPKQYYINLLQSLQYITTQICLLLPTITTHNMLLFADMLHSFGHGFALHLCKK